jgi:hypothetical protein
MEGNPTGAGGTEPQEPEGGGENPAPANPPNEVDRLKGENAQLRNQLRESEAKSLRSEYDLSDEQFEALKQVPRDRQEDRAKALAFENLKAKEAGSGSTPPAATSEGGATPEPAEGPNPTEMGTMQGGGEAGVQPEVKTAEQQLIERIQKTTNPTELEALQNELRGLQAKRQ